MKSVLRSGSRVCSVGLLQVLGVLTLLAACSEDEPKKSVVPVGSGGASAGAAGTENKAGGGAGGANGGTGAAAGQAGSAGEGATSGGGSAGTGGAPEVIGAVVDCESGSDDAEGTLAAPLKSLAKAASVATSGTTILVLDGACTKDNQVEFNTTNGSIKVPDGVTLRAQNAGQVTFSGITGYRSAGVEFLGSGAISGIRFELFGRAISASSGTLTVSQVSFNDIYQGAPLELSGTVEATLTPGTLENYIGDNQRTFAVLTNSAKLTINGGVIRGAHDSGISGAAMLSARDTSELVLDAVTLEDNNHSGILVTGTAKAIVRNASLIKNTASQACCNAASVHVDGQASFELLNSKIDLAPVSAILLTNGSPKVLIKDSSITNGNAAPIQSAVYSDALPEITIENSKLNGNKTGIFSNYSLKLEISGSEIIGAEGCNHALAMNLPDSKQVNQIKIRSTKIGGCSYGLRLSGDVGSTFDLGRGNSPGQNTFTGASTTNVELRVPADTIVYASGNTWTPNVQGAAAENSTDPLPGQYKVPDNETELDIVGAQAGKNYTITGANVATTTLRLAEQP